MSYSRDLRAELSPAALVVAGTVHLAMSRQVHDDALALRHARWLVLEPVQGWSTEEGYRGVVEALASRAELSVYPSDDRDPRDASEEQLRDHLQRVVGHLEEMRPWPEPVLRALDSHEWPRYRDARVVGRLLLDVSEVERRVPGLFDFDHGSDDPLRRYIVLRLRGGRDVALAGPWWPGEDTTGVLSLDREVSAARVMAELTAGSHFEPGEFEVVE